MTDLRERVIDVAQAVAIRGLSAVGNRAQDVAVFAGTRSSRWTTALRTRQTQRWLATHVREGDVITQHRDGCVTVIGFEGVGELPQHRDAIALPPRSIT